MVNKKELQIKQSDRYLRYSIHKEDFSGIEYKVLMNQKEHGLLECYKVDYNGSLQLVYDTESYKPLSSLLTKMTSGEFFRIVSELYQIAEHIKNNGFMKNSHVEIAADKIFLDQMKNRTYLIYLPINLTTEQEQESIEAEIRKLLLKIILEHNNLYDNSIQELHDDIKVKELSLEYINRKIQQGEYTVAGKQGQEVGRKVERRILFISNNLVEPIMLRIDKDDYRIGKKVGADQGLITNYPTVSREHCKLTHLEGQYYITDLGSANGTYINEQRISSQVAYPIRVGDRIRLANLMFDIMEDEA